MRNLIVEGSYNVRDLGGYPTEDGRSTRWNMFIRSGGLDNVSPEGCQYLIDYGVKSIIDLRDEWEVEKYPNVLAQSEAIYYVNLPLIGNRLSQDDNWNLASDKYDHLHQLYNYYLDQCQPQIAAIFDAMVESLPGTVFHCYMGKDRTGVIAGLLLGAMGVPDEVIADDYALTNQHYGPMIPEWRVRAEARGENLAHFDRDAASAPETMMETLAHISTHYGGVSNYLIACGVTREQIEELQKRFVE